MRKKTIFVICILVISLLMLTGCDERSNPYLSGLKTANQSMQTLPVEQQIVVDTNEIATNVVVSPESTTAPTVQVAPSPTPAHPITTVSEPAQNSDGTASTTITTTTPDGQTVINQTINISVPPATQTEQTNTSAGTASSGSTAKSSAPSSAVSPYDLPIIITKNPTSETVAVGGGCSFVAGYNNALLARWHFVSPSGTEDYVWSDPAIAQKFPYLSIKGGDVSTLRLSNIPWELSGWKFYCRYSNNVDSKDTTSASVTVVAAAQQPTPTYGGKVTVTKSPTSEIVNCGGSCSFVARHKNATVARWHFVEPNGLRDYLWSDDTIAYLFPTLGIQGGDYSTLVLSNIPYGLSGWHFYCRYSNGADVVDTQSATVTVRGAAEILEPWKDVPIPEPIPVPIPVPVNPGGGGWHPHTWEELFPDPNKPPEWKPDEPKPQDNPPPPPPPKEEEKPQEPPKQAEPPKPDAQPQPPTEQPQPPEAPPQQQQDAPPQPPAAPQQQQQNNQEQGQQENNQQQNQPEGGS